MSTKRDGRIAQRYECTECGSPSTVHVDPRDANSTIGYACSNGCGVVEHEPNGMTDWYSTPDR